MRPSVLIVVPTLNESENIERTVRALSSASTAGHTQTLVVVDGGSNDDTAAIVARLSQEIPNVKFLNNSKRIQSAGINLAVRTYGGDADVLVRCDCHAIYPPQFVPDLLAVLDMTGADSIVVVMDSIGTTCMQRAIAWIVDSKAGSGGSAHRAGLLSGFVDHGHHAAMRMTSFTAVRGYDESFTHNEDAELDCRLRAVGGRIYLDANIRVQYFPRRTLRSLWYQYFSYGKGRSRTVRRHPGSLRLRQFLVPAHAALMLLAVLAVPFTKLFLLWPAAYFLVMAALSVSITTRERSLCGLLSGIAGVTLHTAWAAGFFWGLLRLRESRWIAPGAQLLGRV